VLEIGMLRSTSGDGKRGVCQSAPSYRAHPRLYRLHAVVPIRPCGVTLLQPWSIKYWWSAFSDHSSPCGLGGPVLSRPIITPIAFGGWLDDPRPGFLGVCGFWESAA
jgi:hypothetical protein